MDKKIQVAVQKRSRRVLAGLAILVAAIIFFAAVMLMFFPYLIPFPSLNPLYTSTISSEYADADSIIVLNSYMAAKYNSTIYPEGKALISAELEKMRQIPDPEARLDEIFVWEMKDWVRPDDNLSAVTCANAACSYQYLIADHDRVKASPHYDGILYPQKNPNGIYYADDPYWIAYNKVGECREYSVLFAFMAQRSGINARLVRTLGHQWVEVELANGTFYYDPWCADANRYYNANDGNMTFRNKWFNTIGSFDDNCHPPDPFPISYNEFPYVWATPKYFIATEWHNQGRHPYD